jgi:VIT family
LFKASTALVASAAITLVALAIFGYVKGRFTGAAPLRSSIQTVVIGGLAPEWPSSSLERYRDSRDAGHAHFRGSGWISQQELREIADVTFHLFGTWISPKDSSRSIQHV